MCFTLSNFFLHGRSFCTRHINTIPETLCFRMRVLKSLLYTLSPISMHRYCNGCTINTGDYDTYQTMRYLHNEQKKQKKTKKPDKVLI